MDGKQIFVIMLLAIATAAIIWGFLFRFLYRRYLMPKIPWLRENFTHNMPKSLGSFLVWAVKILIAGILVMVVFLIGLWIVIFILMVLFTLIAKLFNLI